MSNVGQQNDNLIEPYGGALIRLIVAEEEREELRARAASLPRLQLTARNTCDLELLATGGFSPVSRFMGQADYRRVLEEMRRADGTLFPIPLTLPVAPPEGLRLDSEVALADSYNNLLAVMRLEEIYEWDGDTEARAVCGTNDLRHPLVAEMNSWGKLNISGELRVLSLPQHRLPRRTRLPSASCE